MTTKLFCLTVNTELKWFLKRHKKIEKYIFQLAHLIPGSVKKTLGSETLLDPDRQQLKTTALHNVPVFLYCDSDPAVDPTRSAT